MRFDPDEHQAQIDAIDAAAFGRLIARQIVSNPSSANWMLVNSAIEAATGWDAEHEQVQELVERLTREATEGETNE